MDLFFATVKIINDIKQQIFIIENVEGLVRYHKKDLDYMRVTLFKIGYQSTYKILVSRDFAQP